MGQQRSTQNYNSSTPNFTLAWNKQDFSYYSAGQNGNVLLSQLPENSHIKILHYGFPVLRVVPDRDNFWICSTQPKVQRFKLILKDKAYHSERNHVVEGGADSGIVRASVLDDKKRILTEDASGKLSLFDVTQCKKIQDFQDRKKFEDQLKDLKIKDSTPQWFSVDPAVIPGVKHLFVLIRPIPHSSFPF